MVVGSTLSVLTAVVVFIVALNFRDYGIVGAKQKSYITAELVRDALTAHMVNGMMDQRRYFLGQISSSQNIKDIWLVRAESVVKQFGPSLYNEVARDKIDNEVIKNGVPAEILDENPKEVVLRVTIPYVASSLGNPNCLDCHQAKDGEVLGAISMVFDISDIRQTGMFTIIRILSTAIFFLVLAIIITNYFINPYLELFESIKNVVHSAEEGDFSHRVVTKLKDEAGDTARWINSLHEKLMQTINEIDEKITILLTYDKRMGNKNPLIRTKEIISDLSDIYKFKKTIELDKNKYDIYKRMFTVLEDKFQIREYAFFETKRSTSTRELVNLKGGMSTWCNPKVEDSIKECRAHRTDTIVYADDFVGICENCTLENNECYICIPFKINTETGIILTIKPIDIDDNWRIKHLVPSILSYFEAAKPMIESKLLMEILRESSLKDALTGLYNRKFLEEYIDKATKQATRSNVSYGILMLDIDYFKMVNDTYGHDVGDLIIKGLSDTLRENTRDSDLAIRFGGEEFIIMLYNSDHYGAMMVADKIRKSFEKRSFNVGKEQLTKTVSIGVCMFPDDAQSLWKAIKYADIALYKAKNGGRNRVERFDESMTPEGENY